MAERPTHDLRREPCLHLALTADAESITILGAVRITGAAGAGLHAPILSAISARTLAAPASEIVLHVIDASGAVLGRWGWPYNMVAFFDRMPPRADGRGQLRGSPGRFADGIRLTRIPLPPGAVFLYFTRSDVGPVPPDPGALVFRRRPLALYYLGPSPPPVPPLPELWPAPDDVGRLLKQVPELPSLVFPPPLLPPNGRLLDPVLLHGDGTHEGRFNLVVVGDGFGADNLTDYSRVAALIANGLLRVEPLRSKQGLVNIWSIPTQSLDSGITKCPMVTDVKRTYYRVSGCYDGMVDYPGYVGTATPDLVYGAASIALGLGPERVGAFLVVANCDTYGGSAFPHQNLAFVTTCPSDQDIVDVAVHECAHVIAHLAEEYIGCSPQEVEETYPNQATLAHVGPPQQIPWAGLAESHEQVGGKLKAVYRYERLNGQVVWPKPIWLAGNWLGAYWGCQDFDEDEPMDLVGCNPYEDPRGQNYFRPMWDCRMRSGGGEFCRVCRDEISRRLIAATL